MGTFEDLLDLAGPSFDNPQWIQIECVTESVSDKTFPDIKYVKFVLIASRIDAENGLCYYWRRQMGYVQDFGMDEHKATRLAAKEKAEDALAKLIAHATVRAFIVIRGVVAMPTDLRIFEGGAKVLEDLVVDVGKKVG
jgi:hypothetical protein